jgi:pimeloyl-ACP methyl ester carboxylesterase
MSSAQERPTIVLIHGASHGGWCWDLVTAELEARGYRVVAPDLPGPEDGRAASDISFADYRDAVSRILLAEDKPVLLAGHSLGGMSITLAAEAHPDRVKRLVYVTALLPADGETVMTVAPQVQEHIGGPPWEESADGKAVSFTAQAARDLLYNMCTQEASDAAYAQLRPQPLGPLMEPIRVSRERFGRVPKSYVLCTEDRILPLQFQKQLCDRVPSVERIEIKSDHSPFMCAAHELSDILDRLAAA